MKAIFTSLARRLWTDFDALAELDQAQLSFGLYRIIFSLPWAMITLGWLLSVTDLELIRNQWPFLIFLLALSILFSRFSFFQLTKLGGERYSYNSSDLSEIILFSAIFIFGPTAVWLQVSDILINYASRWSRSLSRDQQISWIYNLIYNMGIGTMNILLALAIYQKIGGSYPLAEIRLPVVTPAFIAILGAWSLSVLFMLILFYSTYWFELVTDAMAPVYQEMIRQTILFFVMAQAPGVFGILAAAIYSQMGFPAFLFFVCAALLVSMMTRRLSQAVILGQQKTGELDQLEQLGRAIIAGPADASTLPEILADYVPKMMIYYQIEIRLFDGRVLLQLPEGRPPLDDSLWPWLQANPQAHEFKSSEVLPWPQDKSAHRLVITPILSTEDRQPLGGILLVEGSSFIADIATDVAPAMQVLAAQIASALHAAKVFAQTLEHQKVAQELAFGGQIQASFLPQALPEVPGWRLAATLLPARETSGDFYDLIPLSNGRLGIVVADVTDKGVGAALIMALSRTLIRSYAMEHPDDPANVLARANQRLQSDAHTDLFVTTFYGVLDPANGTLTYANAGHNPPYLAGAKGGSMVKLVRTGMALGVMGDARWEQKAVPIPPGGALVLYSDGITDAQNSAGENFGEARLTSLLQANCGTTATELQQVLVNAVDEFTGQAPQFDDITLVVLVRER